MKRYLFVCLCLLMGLQASQIVDYKITPDDLKNNPKTLIKALSDYPMEFSINIKVNSDTLGSQFWPAATYDSNRKIIHAVWYSDYIYYSKSTDEGITWLPNEKINSPCLSKRPCIILDDNGQPVVAWVGYQIDQSDIYVSLREEGVWTEPIRINDGEIHDVDNPDIFYKNGKCYISWTDKRNGALADVYTSYSTNLIEWSENVRANDDLGYRPVASDPQIIVGENNVIYLVFNGWEGNVPGGRYPDTYFTKSTDGGQTWMSPQIRMNIQTASFQQDPSIAIDEQGWLYAVWEDKWRDPWTAEMTSAKSTNGGKIWSNKRIDDGPDYSSRLYPKIIFNNGYLNVAWGFDGRRFDRHGIYFTLSDDRGETWSPNQKVNDEQYWWINGGVTLAGNNKGDVYCVWHEYHQNNTIFYEILSSKGTLKPTGININKPDEIFAKHLRIYPNPFIQSTIISYCLEQARDVQLALYDLSGRQIITLLDKKQSPGQHSFIYRPKHDLPQGVYILRIKIGDYETRQKMIFLK